MPSDKELILKVDRARWWLLSNAPFYGQIVMGLTDELGDVKTACTNGRTIKWGREFMAGLTDRETRFVLMHEGLHCAHGHFWRLPVKEPAGQQAGDYAVNAVLAHSVLEADMLKNGLLDGRFNGMAEEEILAQLRREQKPDNQGQPQPEGGAAPDPGGCGSFGTPAPDRKQPSKLEAVAGPVQPVESLKEEWERRVIQAAQAAKAAGRGDLPGDAERLLSRVLAQKVDWRAETADFVRSVVGCRNDWSRSSRRMATQPVIYPRRQRDRLGLVVFVRDTSGSVDENTISAFNALIADCLGDVGADGLVLDCDASVKASYRVGAGEEVPLTAKGGGGTCFEPAFTEIDRLISEGESISGVIYLTDGDGSYPKSFPEYPTLWIMTTNNQAPFGRTVKIN